MQNENVITAKEQPKLTPAEVIEALKQGNIAFAGIKNSIERVRAAVKGQYPKAIVLSCIDSRVLVEDIFQCGVGDIFVARVAGNIVNSDILGSMEYACRAMCAKLIVVMGHGHCGAIKAAIDGIEFGNITGMLEKIKPAIAQSRVNFQGITNSSNDEFIEKVCCANVKQMVNYIRKDSPILKDMEDKGEIRIMGAVFNMETGKVDFFENI